MKTLKAEREAIVEEFRTTDWVGIAPIGQRRVGAQTKWLRSALLSHEEKVRDERDTYWKERVEEVISKTEESARKLSTSYEYEEGTYKGLMYSISLIRDITNEDNLK